MRIRTPWGKRRARGRVQSLLSRGAAGSYLCDPLRLLNVAPGNIEGAAPVEISVVIPFFNAAPFIERCARGLLSQGFPEELYEVIMVDNNSTDRSAEIVRSFPAIKLLDEPQQGSYAARNRGVREARGRVVAFTDPDCVPRPDWLKQIARAMEDPQVNLVLGDRRFAVDAGVVGMLAAYESELGARIFGDRRVDCYFGYTNNMAVRTSVLRALGGFQTLSRGADSLFMRQVIRHYGAEAVRHSRWAVVRHLEISSVHDYLEKKRIYGQINGNPETNTPGALPFVARLEAALKAGRQIAGSPLETLAFLGVLAAGSARFEWERWKRRAARCPSSPGSKRR